MVIGGPPRFLICYRRSDSTAAVRGRIFDRLANHYGKALFADQAELTIRPGEEFRTHCRKVVRDSDIVLVIVGANWLGKRDDGTVAIRDEADAVRIEVEEALRENKHIIPILIDAASMPQKTQLPDALKEFTSCKATTISSGADFGAGIKLLIQTIDGLLAMGWWSMPSSEGDKDQMKEKITASTSEFINFDVFISYAQQDKATADAACAKLEADGIRCWVAPRDVPPGTEWAGAIVDAIDHCRAMVLVFSSNANQSKQIHREVQRAFEKEVPVVPFRIENVAPQKGLAYYMGPVHWLDALTPPLEQHLQRLSTSVQALVRLSAHR
jgi:TIR domain